jgi:hypothetical protein
MSHMNPTLSFSAGVDQAALVAHVAQRAQRAIDIFAGSNVGAKHVGVDETRADARGVDTVKHVPVVRTAKAYAAVVATWWVLQLTMNAWASHVPHRAPVWLMAVASRLVWTGSPVVLSLVYHLEHHAHPRVPCATLRPDLDLSSPLLQQQQQRALTWAPLQPQRPRPSHVLRGMG